MGVMSKLLYGAVPKSLTSLMLWMLPIAAVAVIVVYPQYIMKLLVREDHAKLLEELTEEEAAKRKKKQKKGKKETVWVAKSETKEEELEIQSNETSEDEQLLQLVAQARTSQRIKVAKPKEEIQSPVTTAIVVNPPSDKDEESGWSRIPTKEEEIISALKSKLANLTRQLEISSKEAIETKTQLEVEQKHAAEAEKDLKDRTRMYQIRWVEMENEINNLKNSKEEQSNKLQELSATQSKAIENEEIIESLNVKVALLHSELAGIAPLKDIISSLNTKEAKLQAELQSLRASIAHENEALTLEKKDSAELDGKLTKALEQVSYLSAKLAQQQEVEDHLKLAVVNLERELSSTRDRSNNLEQLEKQLTANNEYNLGLVADKEARIIELNKMIIELEVTRDELKLQSQQLESSITELKENLKQKDDNNLTETFAELEIANGNVTRLEAELDALRAEHTRQAEEMDSIRSASEVIVKELSSKFHELQDAFIASQNERMELAQNAEKTDARIRDAEIQLAKAEKKNGIIQSVAEAKYAAFQKEVEDLKAENARLVQTTTPQ